MDGGQERLPPTRLLVLQGTPFCNLDCSYCYLPSREDRRRMSLETVSASVAWLYRELHPADPLSIIWHAGEPLVLPARWYDKAFAAVRSAAPTGARIRHHFQTNATLIDESWCDFFLAQGVVVGISLDGFAELHDRNRRTRGGGGSHAQAMRGIAACQRRGVPFHVICVVHAATLDAADALADFFLAEGIARVGLNIEEIEGVHAASSLAAPGVARRYERFLDRLLVRAEESGSLYIREADAFVAKLLDPAFGRVTGNDENQPFAIVTVTHDGAISTFSPELAGLTHPVHGPFRFGNVANTSRADILADRRFRAIASEIASGVASCSSACRYFAFCGGGAPSNKLSENGTCASSETLFCRLTQQSAIDVMLTRMESRATARDASFSGIRVEG